MDKFTLENFNLTYSDGVHALQNITMQVPAQSITVLFGPAAGGKSSLLRTLNRLNDLADVHSTSGSVVMYGSNGEAGSTSTAFNLLDTRLDVINLRRRVAMVFARPIVLPLTIRQNLTYGLEVAGERDKSRLEAAIERSLKQAALWDEVADRLDNPATALSGGQQQRLCLARSLALEPDVILLDEPTSGLDPLSTAKVEASLQELKSTYTIILVPHSIQQAARMADQAGFFLQGELIEFSPGKEIFITPRLQKTQDYVEGRFG